MRQGHWLVFDEYLQSGTATAYTDQSHNSKLGMYDQLSLQAVVDNVNTGSTGFKVQIEHSADGRNWLNQRFVEQGAQVDAVAAYSRGLHRPSAVELQTVQESIAAGERPAGVHTDG